MNTAWRSHFHSATTIALSFAWLVATCSCTEQPAVVLSRRSVCERGLLTERDLQGILRGPILGSRLVPGDPQSCALTTRGHSRFEITMRPKRGKVTVRNWIDGSMALEAVPLHGVGELAAWQRDLHEVIAERGDALCDIAVIGTEGDFVDTSEYVLEDRIGNLCNKLLGSIQ